MNQAAKAMQSGALVQSGPETAECSWITTSDGDKHFLRSWRGLSGYPVCIYLHGIEGHGRWFEQTALVLQAGGLTVYAADRRGAGRSETLRGHLQSHQRLLADIEELIAFVLARESGPLFLIANCWGAKAAIVVATQLQNQALAGLILTSPAVCVKVDVDIFTKIKIAFSYLSGSKKTFAIPLTAAHFTDSPAYLKYIDEDPLRLKEATAAFFLASLRLTSLSKAAASRLTLPVLVMQAGNDQIVNVDGIQRWFANVRAQDKTFAYYPTATHSLDFDGGSAAYQLELKEWMMARASTGKNK